MHAAKQALELLTANPRGFCAGVSRAIEIVERALERYGSPLYVRHEIVHNKLVVGELKAKGVIFVDELEEVPADSNVIFSAHGVAEKVYAAASNKNLNVIDATCPLVRRVHFSAKRHDGQGAEVVLIGHAGHPEVEGTMGQLPAGRIHLVETEADVDDLRLGDEANCAYITQTTLSVEDTRAIIQRLRARFPKIQGPDEGDLCYATTNRQAAVRELCKRAQLVLIIGSQNSSNCNRLKDLALESGVMSHLVDSADDIRREWFAGVERVGISSGASTPEKTVSGVIAYLRAAFEITATSDLVYTTEDVHFSLPKQLR